MKGYMLVIPVTPVPKPRMTQSDRWKQRPAVLRYRTFKDELRLWVKGSLEGKFTVVFRMPMPPSWSESKKSIYDGKPHQNKPDIDNLLKGLMDALCAEDQHVYDVSVRKFWSREGQIELTEHI